MDSAVSSSVPDIAARASDVRTRADLAPKAPVPWLAEGQPCPPEAGRPETDRG